MADCKKLENMQKRGNNIWKDREKRYIVIKLTVFWQNAGNKKRTLEKTRVPLYNLLRR